MINRDLYGEIGKIAWRRKHSEQDASKYLKLIADCLSEGKPLPMILSETFIPQLYKAASLAEKGEGMLAARELGHSLGLTKQGKREKSPTWEIFDLIEARLEKGYDLNQVFKEVKSEFDIDRRTIFPKWEEYQKLKEEQEKIFYSQMENFAKELEKEARLKKEKIAEMSPDEFNLYMEEDD